MSFRTARPVAALVALLALVLGLLTTVQVSVAPTAGAAASGIEVSRLTTNGRTDPLGIPGAAPSFGWSSTAQARDVVQSAYQVRVATSEGSLAEADVWDSGKVQSDRQVDVVYDGPALASQTRYVWQVRVWDGAGEASEWSEPGWFETGMLDAEDWGDAAWVAAPSGSEVTRWTDYTADFDFSIQNHAFAAFVRATNAANAYMWQVSVADGTPRFRPHVRVNGTYQLLGSIDISSVISAQELTTGRHTMTVQVDGDTITTSIDGDQIDSRTLTQHARGFVGFRSDHANGTFEQFTVHRVTVEAESGETLLDTDFQESNPFDGGTWTSGSLVLDKPTDALYRSSDSHRPLLRTEFATEGGKTVERARVYASARGIYELNLNGEKVGDQFLAPGWTDYADRIQSQTYDVTDLVASGQNSFGAELGDGWWAGKVGMWGPRVYGQQLSVVARLRIDYTDGTSQWVDTDDTWTSHRGPYVFTDNIDGETYDARYEQPGWDEPGYDDSAWQPVEVAPSATDLLVPQGDEPVRVTEELSVVERTEPTPDTYIYDLGQNMVGVIRVALQGEAGDTVRIRYGEELNPDGTLYTANMRAAKVTDYYTFADDGTATYEPKFTQHGFRYVEITGADQPPAAEDLTGVVWGSDLPATGTLETSSPMLNQLASNISWGQRGNFLSIPTDTPARDERLGWSGDINVFAPTASYLRDTRAFLRKWMQDMSDTQFPNGDLPGIAPEPPGVGCCGSGTGWSDAGITVPYALWDAYGDASIAREFYPVMTAFMDYLIDHTGADLIDEGRGGWGDWLHLDDPTPTAVMGTAYLAEDARMMAEMAAAIGKDADAAQYAQLSEDARSAFTEAFVSPDGTVSGGSQTAYAMALGMDLVTDDQLRDAVAAKFVAKLAASGNHLTTGFLGTPWLLPALSSIGRDDLAFTLLMHEDYPSWGYEVAMGATTMWERWNSINPDGSFGDASMNSFNHYAYGAVGDWMYENVGGISAAEPGYKVARIAPKVGGGLTHGKGELRTVYGDLRTDWNAEGDDFTLSVEVPVNTTAEVVLPAPNEWAVLEGGGFASDAEGVHDVTVEDGSVTVTVGSGAYDFVVAPDSGDLGEVLDLVDEAVDHVEGASAAGDLTTDDADHLTTGLGVTRDDLVAAVMAVIDDDAEAAAGHVGDALDGVRDLREWLAGSAVDRPVRGAIDARLQRIESRLSRSATEAVGVAVSLPPVAGEVLPDGEVAGTLDLVNDGDQPVTGLTAEVTVDGWEPVTVELAELGAGESVQLPVTARVPADAEPGGHDAALSVSFTVGGDTYSFDDTTTGWVQVTSGIEVGEPDAHLVGDDPAERATIEVPLTNGGSRDVRVSVTAALPSGWASVPSAEVVVPAGGEATAEVPVAVPVDRIGGPVAVRLDVVRSGSTLASSSTELDLEVPFPPAANVVDHVDFGDTASEQAHALQASPTSGTNVEAGYTRRYSHADNPGSWYSVELDVPAGEPFVLRGVETFDKAITKKYNVYVDDVLVETHLVPRTEGGLGIKVYDTVIDHPSLADNDGLVRVKFEFPTGAAGFGDPSLADIWVLPFAEDAQAPDVAATVVDGTAGDEGWYRSPVRVALSAADSRDAAPRIEYGEDAGWLDYVAPVTFDREGEHEVSYRATDAAGNRSAVGTLPVRIDLTAPVTEVRVTRGSGVDGSDRATLGFTATDALSGVATTVYRVDGGPWSTAGDGPVVVEGYGEHLVEFASTDVAGNAEPVRRAVVSLVDVDAVTAVVPPQVSGTPAVGATLEATAGSWNTKGLDHSYQWLRNGSPVSGATGPTYRLGKADLGKRLSVRVTATKAGLEPGEATSAATAPVRKAASAVKVTVGSTRVRPGQKVRVAALVTAVGVKVTGKVRVLVDGKVARTLRLAGGKAATQVRIKGKGKHRLVVHYLGSGTVAASRSSVTVVRAR